MSAYKKHAEKRPTPSKAYLSVSEADSKLKTAKSAAMKANEGRIVTVNIIKNSAE